MTLSTFPKRLAPLAAASLLALLAACGGGGDTAGSTSNVSDGTAQAMSADSSALSEDGTEATDTLLATTQAVVAGGQASVTVNCAGGGTAVFTVTGNAGGLGNGQFDTGEVYNVTYSACRGSAGAASIDGSATLTVVSATSDTVEVSTTTQDIVVTLPLRTLTLNGSSTLSRSVVTNGATTTTTTRWVSPQIVLTSRRNARTSAFTLSNVDMTRSIDVTGGVISARSFDGTHTISAQLPNGSWSVTTATQGAVSFDANGVPTQGNWTLTLPNNIVGISVVPGTVTITLDYGADGTIDKTIVITTGQLAAAAD